tara:strand:+ start:1682 stop:1981 length:300 start_codon:yes stop_codon:yes gene_type:complete
MSKQTFVVYTQYLENYGAHSDPEGFYWKPKGGGTYIVSNCVREWDAAAAVTLVAGSTNSMGATEYVTKVMPLSEWDPSHEDMHEHRVKLNHINVDSYWH